MTETVDAAPAAPRRVKVWDAPTRLVHWAIVALIAVSWATAKTHHLDWHRWSGYAVLGLLIFRLLWGLAGPTSARFASFLKGPRAVGAYLRTLPGRRYTPSPGHNPLGGWSVMALLGLMVAQVGLGLFAVDVDGLESGPLSDRVSFDVGRVCAKLHHLTFNLLLWLIGVHLLAILFYAVWKRENLVRAMIDGSRRFPPDAPEPRLRFAPVWRLVLAVTVAAAAAYVISKGLRLR
jgi:cytochrome b